MRYSYTELDLSLLRSLLDEQALRKLFNELLLRSSGDAEEAMQWMRDLQERGYIDESIDLEAFFRAMLEEGTLAQDGEGGLTLGAAGERTIRREALDEIFRGLGKSIGGDHSTAYAGRGMERLTETRPWQFGDDPASIDALRSLQNAVGSSLREGEEITIKEEDLEVFETEHASACATVVMIDLSHSMILYGEDRITPAKKVALALTELILTKYPRDSVDVLVFGDEAKEIPLSEIPYIEVGPFHTNTRAGLQLAQTILRRRRHGNKQIFMITDGKPSALTENGELYTNSFGLDLRIVNKTLEEADRCRRNRIPITTFMLASDPMLVDFVDQLSRINQGRAFYTSTDRVGEFVLADYIRNRRKFVH